MASVRYQSMAREIDHRYGPLRIRRVQRPEHPLQPFQPARPRQLKQQDSASFEYLRSRPRCSSDKQIDRRHHRTSHVIVRLTYALGRGLVTRTTSPDALQPTSASSSDERRQDQLYLIDLIGSCSYELIIACLPLCGGL